MQKRDKTGLPHCKAIAEGGAGAGVLALCNGVIAI